MKVKKVPERMCIACKAMMPKAKLIRIVRSSCGDFLIDETGKQAGRGCYICDSSTCINKCIKSKLLNKAYKADISNEVYEKLNGEYNSKKD